MRRPRLRIDLLLALLLGAFLLGQQSARGAAQQVPMSSDQFLAAIGIVDVALTAAEESHTRVVSILTDRFRGRYTQTEADTLIRQIVTQRNEQVSAAILSYIGTNVAREDRFLVPLTQLPPGVEQAVALLAIKYPALAGLYMR